MKVLVTGCAGFIGSAVTRFCIQSGYQVVGIDNLNNAYDVRLKEWRLSCIQGMPAFTFDRLDIADPTALDGFFESHPVDAVINLAARAGVRQSVRNPAIYYQTNVLGTLNLLECCRRLRIKKFVLASTSSLYAGSELPFREDRPTDRPLSPYAASKKAAEALCYSYHYLYGIDVAVLRYFTVYGPAGRPDMSLFRFVQRICESQPVIIYGDGCQTRDFTYVDDIAKGTLAALELMGYEVINLGSDQPIVLLDAMRLIEGLLGKKAMVQYEPPEPADMVATWANIDKARQLLHWQAETHIEEGLRRLTAWYQENREWARGIATS